jgi:hypothetical protein
LADKPKFDKERQGGRVAMRVPVEIRGTGADGKQVQESAFTAVIGSLGAMILVSQRLQIGSEIDLTNRFSQQTARFRVAWIGDEKAGESWETGLESLKPLDDFWGVRFPPKPGHA